MQKAHGHVVWAIIGLYGEPYVRYYCDNCKQFIEYPYVNSGQRQVVDLLTWEGGGERGCT